MKTIEFRSYRKVEINGELFSIDTIGIVDGIVVHQVTITDKDGLTLDPADAVYKKLARIYL